MDHQHQHMHPRADRQQPRPHRDLHRQVERLGRHLRHRPAQLFFGNPGSLQPPGQLLHRQDLLVRLPVRHGKDGAQHLMPGDDIGQRGFQRGNVQIAV
jgi:hypothetical protein